MTSYTIGQVSQMVGLPTKTIRFYENSGLISEAERANNGYRMYPEAALEELSLLKNARDLGLPISEIRKLMSGCDHDTCQHSRQEVTSSIDEYVVLLGDKIKQFTHLKDKLEKLRANLCTSAESCPDNTYCCNILRQLAEIA